MDAVMDELWMDAVLEQLERTNELLGTMMTCIQVEGRKTRGILKQE